MDYLNAEIFLPVKLNSKSFEFKLYPFEYLDGRKPRLPRKSSKGYNLISDTNFCLAKVFSTINSLATKNRFKVQIIVYNGSDRLGKADLDNYCKIILDGITHTGKVWQDDRQVDELLIKRININEPRSSILIKIFQS
ncbi:RusA family crossover junction endodeoxyribonuclease [Flavobacterium sp.]|uniref:RusA family crossover junction endodeoxyribonuclease n=1 Tax=Flavobacterium sp. TaxID=239 RepID=UPI002604848B|nr:RusA family crossover junction endodeoxyribonuclease [Flavobacterium sp.]